ncbi:MAG: CotH kinase family protein [Pirellulales bacterium]|nr:CotH kinase family protein [Pirellulales bacterium]
MAHRAQFAARSAAQRARGSLGCLVWRAWCAPLFGLLLLACTPDTPPATTAPTRSARTTSPPPQPPPQQNPTQSPPATTEAPSLFARQHLLRVDITLPEEDWTALRMQTRSMATALSLRPGPTPFSYFRGDVTVNGTKLSSVGIRKKGFIGSLDNVRPSLKIKLNHFDDGTRTLEGMDRLTLNNNRQDRSLASQYLSYHLFHQAGVPAPRCNLAVVTVNGENLGIYSHVEAVRTPFVDRHFGTTAGAVFEGTLTDFFADRLERFDNKGNKKWSQTKGREILRQLCDALETETPETDKQLDELIDVYEFLKFWAVESLIGFWDGYSGNQNNFFVYLREDAKIRFIPWGVDSAFSNRRFGPRSNGYHSVFAKGLLANRLNRNPAIREMYQLVLEIVLDEAWDEEALYAELDQVALLASDHLHPRQQGLREGLDEVRRFIGNRRAEIEQETQDGAVAVENRTRRPMHTIAVAKLAGSFQTYWNGTNGEPVSQSNGTQAKGLLEDGSFTINDISAIANMGRARRWGRGGTQPTITLFGVRSTDGENITVTITVPPALFRSNPTQPVKVQGRFSQGRQRRGWGSGMLDGQIKLRQAGTTNGARVTGSFELDLYEMRGRNW